jgi:biopolymer transport protein ExbB/TolQ
VLLRTINLFLGAILWFISTLCVLYVFFLLFFGDTGQLPSILRDVLSKPDFRDMAVPMTILAVFGWVLVDIVVRARHVRREHLGVVKFESAITAPSAERLEELRLGTAGIRVRRRAELIGESLAGQGNPHDSLPAAAALDASALGANYVWLHIYAWLLPVLGFIGTANGMATSISGFRDALTDQELSKMVSVLNITVIPGLSSAFETTILALTAALVTYLCASALQSSDQQALDNLDSICLAYLSRLPNLEGAGGVLRALEDLATDVRSVLSAAEEFRGMAKTLGQSALVVHQAAQKLSAASSELHSSIALPYHITVKRGPQP